MPTTDRFMMATAAHHAFGDISRDEPDLAVIYGEDEDAYLGQWVTGFGFLNVRFPKATTRELTGEERQRYASGFVELNGFIAPIGVAADQPDEMDAVRDERVDAIAAAIAAPLRRMALSPTHDADNAGPLPPAPEECYPPDATPLPPSDQPGEDAVYNPFDAATEETTAEPSAVDTRPEAAFRAQKVERLSQALRDYYANLPADEAIAGLCLRLASTELLADRLSGQLAAARARVTELEYGWEARQ